ncbi:MAG: XRE family transcriptional regulator [Nitrospira sp.]|nr:XRE family transcriptional regulator [Nitrospira sp.]
MAASIPAMVTPALLKWARKESGYDPEPAAKRAGVHADKLLAWEQGDAKPTLRQAQALAKLYHRPLGLFFLPQPPSLPPLAAEYRRLPGIEPGAESPELRLALRVMSQRREVTLELSGELDHTVPEFTVALHPSDPPVAAGARLRTVLGITPEEQLEWANEWQAWRSWREAVERIGALVFQFPKVDLKQVRGVALPIFPLPAIGINSKESSAAARSYTLMHELVHVALVYGHEEDVALRERRSEARWQEMERFAEEVASAVLIPDEMLGGFLGKMSVARDAWDVPLVRKLATAFRVTPLAMATRLRSTGALTWNGYRSWREKWDAYVDTLKPRKGGPVSPVDKTLGRAGRPFAQLVLEALDANRITSVDASRYLDLRFDYVQTLRQQLFKGPGGGSGGSDGGDDGD